MKRLIALAIAALAIAAAAAERPRSGRLSKTVGWTFADSVLTISGTGKTPGYNSTSIGKLPWQDERMAAAVKKIVVGEGITEIGSYLFGARAHSRSARNPHDQTFYATQGAETSELFFNIDEVVLPSTLRKIGSHAFVRMPLTHIRFPEALEEIGAGAFSNSGLRLVILPTRVRRVGPEAFGNCLNMRAIDFNGLPLKLSAGLLFGNERLRMLLHTGNIRSIEPSTFNATPLGAYSDDAIADILASDGFENYMASHMPSRENYAGSDADFKALADRTADEFYEREAANATSLFDLDRLRLRGFDAANSTLAVETVHHGLLMISAGADDAAEIARRWDEVKQTARPVFYPADGRVTLQSVQFFVDDRVFAAAVATY